MRISDWSSDVCSSDLLHEMCESGSSARRERWPSSTRRRFPLAIARQNPHIGSMTPQPDPLEAPPPGPPYRGAREPMFNLPPGTLWLGLGLVAAFGLPRLRDGRTEGRRGGKEGV